MEPGRRSCAVTKTRVFSSTYMRFGLLPFIQYLFRPHTGAGQDRSTLMVPSAIEGCPHSQPATCAANRPTSQIIASQVRHAAQISRAKEEMHNAPLNVHDTKPGGSQ